MSAISLSPFEIRSIINSVRSSCLPAFLRLLRTDLIGISCLQPCGIRPFISWLGSVVRLEAQLEELALYFYFFLNSIAVSEVLLDRWSPLALVPISSRFFWKARYSCMCDRGFHGSSSSSSTLGGGSIYLKEVRTPPIVRYDAVE